MPLKRVNDRRGVRYFTTAADPAKASYWEAPISRSGGIHALDHASCDGAALIRQLRTQQLKPSAAGQSQASLTDFIYPLH